MDGPSLANTALGEVKRNKPGRSNDLLSLVVTVFLHEFREVTEVLPALQRHDYVLPALQRHDYVSLAPQRGDSVPSTSSFLPIVLLAARYASKRCEAQMCIVR